MKKLQYVLPFVILSTSNLPHINIISIEGNLGDRGIQKWQHIDGTLLIQRKPRSGRMWRVAVVIAFFGAGDLEGWYDVWLIVDG